MAGTFAGPYQRFVVNVSQQLGIHVRDSHDIGQLVIVFLGHFTFVDNDGIVQIATLDESGRQQWLDFTDKYKGTVGAISSLNFFISSSVANWLGMMVES